MCKVVWNPTFFPNFGNGIRSDMVMMIMSLINMIILLFSIFKDLLDIRDAEESAQVLFNSSKRISADPGNIESYGFEECFNSSPSVSVR